MERMEEYVANADDQALQYMLTESNWDSQPVMKQVAQDADQMLGGSQESCLLLDESSFAKKGKYSVGVARQWCGRHGKVDNCQVGVFAVLGRGHRTTLTDFRLYLPERWTSDQERCDKAGIPEAYRAFKTKSELAIEMVKNQREMGVRFAWVGADGGYGKEPAFLRGIEDLNETFVVDIHKDQTIYLEDPKPTIPPRKSNRGRKPVCYKTETNGMRVDKWIKQQPETDWHYYTLRDSTKGELKVQVLHQRVWLWDNRESKARYWHLIVRKEPNSPETLKYTLSNAPEDIDVHQLAKMQGQRFWVERAFQDGKSEAGMADYQARKWSSWHHHMTLVSMAMLFMTEEREMQRDEYPLLSCNDIELLLRTHLPRRDIEHDEVRRQMEKRHQKRQASIDSAFKKQRILSAG